MAIVNLTPDSFYASSRHASYAAVKESVERAVSEGATIVDLGGYSSRSGADEVTLEEEWQRVEMGLQAVRDAEVQVVVSIDTFRSEIVRRAYEGYGPFIVNDISAGEVDKAIVDVVAKLGLPYVAMHMRGTPETMQSLTDYEEGVTKGVVLQLPGTSRPPELLLDVLIFLSEQTDTHFLERGLYLGHSWENPAMIPILQSPGSS